MNEIVFFNGRFMKHKDAHVSLDDHGFLYGDGVYETLRVYDGRVFLVEAHLRRLQHSAAYLGIKLPFNHEKLAKVLTETARRNKMKEAVLRLTVTRGPGLYGFDPALCFDKPTIAIVSRPFVAYPRWQHEKGIRLAVVSIRRNAVSSLPPHVKSTSCVNGIYAKVESLKFKAQEGLMLTHDGFLTEATVSNIFMVKDGILLTPILDGSLLAGTTRGYVIGLAKKLKLRLIEKKLNLTSLFDADEVFLTNTTMEVLPVTTIVNNSGILPRRKKVSYGAVGPVTHLLKATFRNI